MAAANPTAMPSESASESSTHPEQQREILVAGDLSTAPWSSSASSWSSSSHTGSTRSTTPSGVASLQSKIPHSNVIDPIDSALLAALRDARERLGLLRLEQVFLQFLKSEDPFWEVGGAGNAQVRNGKGVSIGNGDPNASTAAMMGYRPQTSFQRCILHRLADRFQITREPQENGFIRICKTPSSGLPSRLLLNVSASEYLQSTQQLQQQQPQQLQQLQPQQQPLSGPNTQSQQRSPNLSLHQLSSSSSLEDQTEQQLSLQTSLKNNTTTAAKKQKQKPNLSTAPAGILPNPTGGPTSKSSKTRKMKIMKRSSSNLSNNSNASKNSSKGSTSNNNGSGTTNNNSNGNSMSDRERKYAEARARIFQQSQEEAMAETLPLAATAHLTNTSGDSSAVAATDPSATFPNTSSMQSVVTTAPMSSTISSSLTATSAEYVPPTNSLHGSISNPIQNPLAPSSSLSPQSSMDASQNHNNNIETNPGSSGSINKPSKATWRNRQSEMQDPDFRRRRTPVVVHPVAGNHHARNTTAAVAAALNGTPPLGFGYAGGGASPYHHSIPNGTIGSQSTTNTTINAYYPPQTSPSISKLKPPPQNNFYPTAAATSGVSSMNNKAASYTSPATVGYAALHFPPSNHQQPQQPHSQVQPRYHAGLHSSMAASATAATTSVPSIHSSQEFPSLR